MAIRLTRAGVALTVGIILVAGLIIGGFFLVRHLGEQARRDQATEIAEQNLEQQSEEGAALNEGDAGSESQPNREEVSETEEGNAPQNQGTSADQTPANELPATGPADASAVFIFALVAFAGVSYYGSRQALQKK